MALMQFSYLLPRTRVMHIDNNNTLYVADRYRVVLDFIETRRTHNNNTCFRTPRIRWVGWTRCCPTSTKTKKKKKIYIQKYSKLCTYKYILYVDAVRGRTAMCALPRYNIMDCVVRAYVHILINAVENIVFWMRRIIVAGVVTIITISCMLLLPSTRCFWEPTSKTRTYGQWTRNRPSLCVAMCERRREIKYTTIFVSIIRIIIYNIMCYYYSCK
jgi:hypothetical protein